MIDHPEINAFGDLPLATYEFSPAFHDIDPMNVVWHGNYIKYFELARCAVLQQINYDYPQMQQSGYAWPIVDIRSRFVAPAVYTDRLVAVAAIVEWEVRLLIKYLIIRLDDQRVLTRGQSVQVPVDEKTLVMEFGCPDILEHEIRAWQQRQHSAD